MLACRGDGAYVLHGIETILPIGIIYDRNLNTVNTLKRILLCELTKMAQSLSLCAIPRLCIQTLAV